MDTNPSHLRRPPSTPHPRRRPIGIHLGGEGPPRVCIPFSYGRRIDQRRGSARVGEGAAADLCSANIDDENEHYRGSANRLSADPTSRPTL